MARRPPQRPTVADARGPRETKKLPDRPDAKRTWSGPPYERTPRRWSGTIDFGGKKHNVGTFDTPRAWGIARDALIVELRKNADAPAAVTRDRPLEGLTIAGFIESHNWPYAFKRKKKRSQPSTFDHHAQCIRPFVARFGDRPITDGVSFFEAGQWADEATENQVTSAIAMFNDARSVDRRLVNPLEGLSRDRTRGRTDLPDVLTPDELTLLRELALHLNPDEHGVVMEAMIEVAGTSAPRPGELWAFERARLKPENGEIYIKYAVKKGGVLGPPKYEQERWCVLAPSALELLLRLPVLHPRFLLPTKTGRLMTQPNWTTYWHPLRDAFTAQLPEDHWLRVRIADCAQAKRAEPDPKRRRRLADGKLDFYELHHRDCTFMATPRPHGLGLPAPDIAYQVGHKDGGRLVERLYIHRNDELARARIRAAMGYADGQQSDGDQRRSPSG